MKCYTFDILYLYAPPINNSPCHLLKLTINVRWQNWINHPKWSLIFEILLHNPFYCNSLHTQHTWVVDSAHFFLRGFIATHISQVGLIQRDSDVSITRAHSQARRLWTPRGLNTKTIGIGIIDWRQIHIDKNEPNQLIICMEGAISTWQSGGGLWQENKLWDGISKLWQLGYYSLIAISLGHKSYNYR